MARAHDLLDLDAQSYPWWDELTPAPRGGIRAVEVNPDNPKNPAQHHTISAGAIHDAFTRLEALGALCCGDNMRHGYDHGCANDADLIIQRAALGAVIYG